MNATHEEWRPVVGWEGLYEVSNLGRVRSLDRRLPHRHPGHTYLKRGRVLKTTKNPPMGYHSVSLSDQRNRPLKLARIHALVLEAFVGPRPDGYQGCHNDGNVDNNRLENLRWDTPAANTRDTIAHGRHPEARKTHCKRGHPFDAENTYYDPAKRGARTCRECVRIAGRKYNASGKRPRRNRKAA